MFANFTGLNVSEQAESHLLSSLKKTVYILWCSGSSPCNRGQAAGVGNGNQWLGGERSVV